MLLRPDTLRKLKDEGVKGIRTRHILYMVPKVQDKNAQNLLPNNPEVRDQGQGKVMQSGVEVVPVSTSGTPHSEVELLNTAYSSYTENAQNSVSANYVPLATSELEENCSQTHKTSEPILILPCADERSPSKYIVKSCTPLPAGCKISGIPMDSSVDSPGKLGAAATKSTVDLSAISTGSQPVTCVSGFIPDMTSPNKYSNSLLPDMEVPAAYGIEEEKTKSEADPYDIDKIIKDMENGDVIGTEEPINEQDLEFMRSMQGSPTDSIMQVATTGQDQGVTDDVDSGSSLFQDQDVQLGTTTSQHAGSLYQNQDSQLDATTSQSSDSTSFFSNQNAQLDTTACQATNSMFSTQNAQLDTTASQDTSSVFQNQNAQLDATTSQDTNSSSLFVNDNITSSGSTQSSGSPTPSPDAYSMDWD